MRFTIFLFLNQKNTELLNFEINYYSVVQVLSFGFLEMQDSVLKKEEEKETRKISNT